MTTESAADVQLVFRGEVLHGFHIPDVRRALGERLRIDDAGLARLFTTPRTVLKKSVSPTDAARYIATFARLGAILHAEAAAVASAAPSPATPAAGPRPVAPPPARPAGPTPLPTIAFPVDPPPAPPPPPPAPAPIPAARVPVAATPALPATDGLALDDAAPPVVDEVTCPNCQERQPRRVLCRNCQTDIGMALAAKEEARDAERAARLEQRRIALGLPAEGTATTDAPGMWGLSFRGRMARLPYWTAGVISGTVLYLMVVLVLQRPGAGRWTLLGIVGLVYFFYLLRWTALRLHDLNASGWWCVVLTVPYIGAAASLALSFVPGSKDDNDYGEPPRPGRWRTFLIASGMFLLAFALTASSALFGVARLMAEDDEDDLIPFDGPAAASAHDPGPGPGALRPEARQAFQTDYTAAPAFKAFAASPSGPWGWHGGASSLSRAAAEAMQHCEVNRRVDQLPCEIVDAAAR